MKQWEMNETQKAFVAEVSNAGENGVTLFDLKLAGKDYKTGSVNVLVTKGILDASEEREYECNLVYNDKIVGKVTKTYKVYKLAK